MHENEPAFQREKNTNLERKIKTWEFIKGFSEADTVVCLAAGCYQPLILLPSALVCGAIWHTADRRLKKLRKSE